MKCQARNVCVFSQKLHSQTFYNPFNLNSFHIVLGNDVIPLDKFHSKLIYNKFVYETQSIYLINCQKEV